MLSRKFLSKIKQESSLILLALIFITLAVKENFNSIALIICLAVGLYTNSFGKQDIKKFAKIHWPFLIYFLVSALSLILAEDIGDVEKFGLKILPFLIIPLVFYNLEISEKAFQKIFLIFCGWLLLLALYSHATVLMKLLADGEPLSNLMRKDYSYLELANTIGLHPTYYAFFLLVCNMFLLHKVLFGVKSRFTKFYILIVIYFSFFIIHLSSRMNIVVLLLVIFGYLLLYFKAKGNLIKGLLYAVVIAVATGAMLYNVRATRYRFQQIVGLTFSNGVRHDDGLNKIKQFKAVYKANTNFVYGNGISNANEDIYESYAKAGLIDFAEKKYNAHNQYLQDYIGMGMLGLIALLSLQCRFFILFVRRKNMFGACFMLATAILFITESYLFRHNGMVLFLLVILMNYKVKKLAD